MEEERRCEMSDEARYQEALRAMESGDEKAKTEVAFFTISGRGGGADIDVDDAVALLEDRVKNGDDDAMWMLGLCCEYGIGMKQDVEGADLLYIQSRDLHNNIGEFLTRDRGQKRGSRVLKVNSLQYKHCNSIMKQFKL